MAVINNNYYWCQTYYDDNDQDNGDFDIFPPHGSCQALAGFLECERLEKKKKKFKIIKLDVSLPHVFVTKLKTSCKWFEPRSHIIIR